MSWGHRPQHDGTDSVNYHRVTSYTGDVLFLHIKFLERGWNDYDDTKDSVWEKIMINGEVQVPHCVNKSRYWESIIEGMVHIKYQNLKCNYHNALRKEIMRK